MRLVEGLALKEWYDKYVDTGLGISPTSTSPQPVHVINGFFHQSLTGRRSTRAAADLVASKDGIWQLSQEDLHKSFGDRIKLPSNEQELQDLRKALQATAATDRAVFRNNHSFQVAHIGLTSTDTVHFGLGSLGAALVGADPENGARMAAILDRLRSPQPNPHWGLQRALVDEDQAMTWEVATPVQRPEWGSLPATEEFQRQLTGTLSRCLEMAAAEVDSLLAVQTLAISLTWVGLLAYAQVPALSVHGLPQPLLLEVTTPGEHAALRDVSAENLTAVHLRFEEWLGVGLERAVKERLGTACSDDEAHHFLATTKPYKLSTGDKMGPGMLDHAYGSYRKSYDEMTSLAYTLRDLLITGMGNKHRSWFHAVGRHCGFVGPRRGRVPRLRVEVSLLPSLVLAGMPEVPTRSLLMADWLRNLSSRFGLLIGPGEARTRNLLVSEEDLSVNQSELARLLASIGLARRYSDGVTEVLDPRTLWGTEND